MDERLNNKWINLEEDDYLQKKFWSLFLKIMKIKFSDVELVLIILENTHSY